MRRYLALFFISIFLLLSSSLTFASSRWGEWTSYVPSSGIIKGYIMVPDISERTIQLMQQFKKAAGKDPTWLFERLKTVEGPLPYDPKFGMTKGEYEEMIEALQNTKLKKGAYVELALITTPDGITIRAISDKSIPLNDITLIDNGAHIMTPLGILDTKSETSTDKSLIGSWKGLMWTKTVSGNQEMTKIHFAIGRRNDRPYGIIDYKVRYFTNKDNVRQTITIYYDL